MLRSKNERPPGEWWICPGGHRRVGALDVYRSWKHVAEYMQQENNLSGVSLCQRNPRSAGIVDCPDNPRWGAEPRGAEPPAPKPAYPGVARAVWKPEAFNPDPGKGERQHDICRAGARLEVVSPMPIIRSPRLQCISANTHIRGVFSASPAGQTKSHTTGQRSWAAKDDGLRLTCAKDRILNST